MSDVAIKIENISKIYHIGIKKSACFRESVGNSLNRFFGKENIQDGSEFWALNDISFEIKKGEAIGIVGKNGAGKSTLLKILSRITEPTKGRIEINGSVSSLLEVGTGFHPELTGRENIFLNGTILGMTRREVKTKFDEIVDFSGVEKFIDTPVKHYSSGMYVRLAFAVAAHLEPEILIIDEVLAVGDAEFQRKCLGKMGEVTGEGRTVIFVSHNLSQVQNLCQKGILLDKGSLLFKGAIDQTLSRYVLGIKAGNRRINLIDVPRAGHKDEDFCIEWIESQNFISEIKEGDSLEVEIGFSCKKIYEEVILGITISDSYNTLIECRSTATYPNLSLNKVGSYSIKVQLNLKLRAGVYNLNIGARCAKNLLEYIPSILSFEILPSNTTEKWKDPSAGVLISDSKWLFPSMEGIVIS